MMGFGTILPSSCWSSRAQDAVDAEVAFDLSRPSAWCATDAVTGSHFAQCVARAPMARSRPMTSTRGAAFEGRGTTCCHPSGYEDLGERPWPLLQNSNSWNHEALPLWSRLRVEVRSTSPLVPCQVRFGRGLRNICFKCWLRLFGAMLWRRRLGLSTLPPTFTKRKHG